MEQSETDPEWKAWKAWKFLVCITNLIGPIPEISYFTQHFTPGHYCASLVSIYLPWNNLRAPLHLPHHTYPTFKSAAVFPLLRSNYLLQSIEREQQETKPVDLTLTRSLCNTSPTWLKDQSSTLWYKKHLQQQHELPSGIRLPLVSIRFQLMKVHC